MPTLTDIVNEIQTLAHDLNQRVDEADKEQKRRSEDLTSKTTTIAAEYKQAFDRVNNRINELTDLIDKIKIEHQEDRIAAARPPISSKAKKEWRNSPAHQAFLKAMRTRGDVQLMTPEERAFIFKEYMPAERKALYAADATTGGFFASTDFIEELIEYKLLISKVRQVARIQQTSGERVQMPSLANDTSVAWAAEQADFSASTDPTVSMISIPVHEQRGLLKVSQQNLEDSMFNLEDLIKERLMLKFAQAEGKAFIVGTGVGQPRGIMSYPQAATTSFSNSSAGKNTNVQQIAYVLSGAAAGKINADDVLNVKMDLKSDYDKNATYAFTRGTLNSIRLLKDSMQRPLWQPFAGSNLPATIYDSPYIELPDMDEIATGKFPVLVGDFKQYLIVDRLTLNIQQLNELYIASGLVGFIARMRVGGDVLLPEAFRILKIN